MKKACIYDIGSCFVFNVAVKDDDLIDIKNKILDAKCSAIIFSDVEYLPFSSGNVSVFLYRAYSRKAFDLYHKLQGTEMRSLDPFCIQRILYSIGVCDATKPEIHILEPIQVIRERS